MAGVLLQGPLDDGFDFGLLHGLADLPMNDGPAVAVEHGAEEVEGAGDVEVRDIDVPVFMDLERLGEALALLRRSPAVGVEQPRPLEHPGDARWADGDHVLIEHHGGEPRRGPSTCRRSRSLHRAYPGEPSDLSGLPTGFFVRMFSSMSSEMISFFWASVASFWATIALSFAIRASLADSAALA